MGAYGRFELRYVRTDRNGTKYFLDDNCPRCSGYGELDKWIETGRVCFACGGSGRRPQPKTVKVYTPEHMEKLEARRAARAPKKSAEELEKARRLVEETRINTWVYEGFGRDGVGYLHTGNTYKNRETLRQGGGRWHDVLRGYIAPVKIELVGVAIREVNAEELCTPGGYIDMNKAEELVKALNT